MEQVMVVLSSYNGEKYIRAQIDSVLKQEGVEVRLLVRDDGSSDNTGNILEEYAAKGVLEWYTGENLKPALSFMDLLGRAGDAPYCALCDQDDVWMPDKLKVAVEMLKTVPENEPAMYYGNPLLTDGDLKPLDKQNGVIPTGSLAQAIIFPLATGCTMVMNQTLVRLVTSRPCETRNMHDYWIHKVCLMTGGHCLCDRTPHVYYRQHGQNAVGADESLPTRMKRHWNTMHRTPRIRSDEVANILKLYGDCIPAENLELCREVADYRRSFLKRMKLVFDPRIRSGSIRWDLLFRIAALMGVL